MMGVGFEGFISAVAGVFRLLRSFTLSDAVVLGRLICLTSTLFFLSHCGWFPVLFW